VELEALAHMGSKGNKTQQLVLEEKGFLHLTLGRILPPVTTMQVDKISKKNSFEEIAAVLFHIHGESKESVCRCLAL